MGIEYATLGLDAWTLFACVRLAMWMPFLSKTEIVEHAEMCNIVREATLIKYCNTEREKDWNAYCGMLWQEGFAIDCQNANKAAKRDILNTIAKQRGGNQYVCIHRV